MGDLLKAKRREARAILKDDLRKLKERHARELANNHRTVAQLQEHLADARDAVTGYSNQLGRVNAQAREVKSRCDKVLAWADQNRKGDFTVRACTEYIAAGPNAHTPGAGWAYCNPFDRWQVGPAIK